MAEQTESILGAKRSRGEFEGSNNAVATLTEDEAALYDRQIRLWGVEAQSRYVIYCQNPESACDPMT